MDLAFVESLRQLKTEDDDDDLRTCQEGDDSAKAYRTEKPRHQAVERRLWLTGASTQHYQRTMMIQSQKRPQVSDWGRTHRYQAAGSTHGSLKWILDKVSTKPWRPETK